MTNLTLLFAAELITPTQRIKNALVRIMDGRITAVEEGAAPPSPAPGVLTCLDGTVIPGLVDLQVNGALGYSFQAHHRAHFEEITAYHRQSGTTTMLPTLITAPEPVLVESLAVLSEFIRENSAAAGIHLEGPFLSPEKRGAHDEACLLAPNMALAQAFLDAASGRLRLFTLAPELPGSEAVTRLMTERGVLVSAGHSAAGYAEMRRAADAGLRFVTHAGNASDWPHRALGPDGFLASEPGVVGALMADERLAGGIILDGYHFHPALLKPLIKVKGAGMLALVSDASTVAGCSPGEYDSGGLVVTVHPKGFATSGRGGGWLAGSTITLLEAVRRAVTLAGLSLVEAAQMAALTPARLLGLEGRKGQVTPGADADLLVLDPHLRLRTVIAGGSVLFDSDFSGNPLD